MNIEVKKTGAEVVHSDRIVVNPHVTARRGQRRSLTHCVDSPETKVNDLGKLASKPILVIRCRLVDMKLLCSPASKATPHPPLSFPTRPE